MPAYASNIDDIYFYAVRLFRGRRNADAKFLDQLLFIDFLPKLFRAVDFYTEHKIFRKFFIDKFLQNEFAAIPLKADVITSIPIDIKTKFLK